MIKASKSQIVATIGPSSGSLEMLNQMIEHHMDVARLNFSWGTHEEHQNYIRNIRSAARNHNRIIPIIQDLSGPRIQRGQEHGFDESHASVITEKDRGDLAFGISQEVDYIALSFVGEAGDILELKQLTKELGRETPVIAKIERKKALDNLNDIISNADALMVARGDLANEVPLEEVPFIQRDIILASKKAGKPVITATQMLLSMTDNPVPTRAEVTDVAYAITIGSDAVMLSEETAAGNYPLEAVTVMEKIILEAEKHRVSGDINLL